MVDFAPIGPVKNVLVRYTQAPMAQTEQPAVCNRLHRLDQQLSRWLLMKVNRARGGCAANARNRKEDAPASWRPGSARHAHAPAIASFQALPMCPRLRAACRVAKGH